MKLGAAVWIAGALVAALFGAGSSSLAQGLVPLGDEWKACEGPSGQGYACEFREGRLRVTASPGASGELVIASSHPVGYGAWALDTWWVQYGDRPRFSTTVRLVDATAKASYEVRVTPSPSRADVRWEYTGPVGARHEALTHDWETNRYAGAGPISWVRLECDPEGEGLTVVLNGQRVCEPCPFVPPSGRISFSVSLDGQTDVPLSCELASYEYTGLGVAPEAARPAGALVGWAREPRPDVALAHPEVLAEFRRMAEDADAVVRAIALAGECLFARTADGEVDAETWQRVSAFMAPPESHDLAVESELLPVVAACANGLQLPEVQTWIARHVERLAALGIRDSSTHAAAGGLVGLRTRALVADPASGLRVALEHNVSPREIDVVAGLVGPDRQALLLPLYCALLADPESRGYLNALAWLLPDVARVSPAHATLARDVLRGEGDARRRRADSQGQVDPRLDLLLSFAAYRMAADDPDWAASMYGLIAEPTTRAETLDAMLQRDPGLASPETDATIEAALRAAVAGWTQKGRYGSRARPTISLARWLLTRERREEASAAVREAVTCVEAGSEARPRELFDAALLMETLGLPEAAGVWQEAVLAASEIDAAYDGPESGSVVWRSPTLSIVRHHLEMGRVDEALAAARSIDAARLPQNHTNAIWAVATHLVQTGDAVAAAALAEGLPECRQRNTLIRELAYAVRGEDAAVARRLADLLPADEAEVVRCRLAMRAEGEPSAELIDEFVRLSLARLEALEGRSDFWGVRPGLLRDLDDLDLTALVALGARFSDHPEFWAHQMLRSFARAAGLEDDPAWRAYEESRGFVGYSQPWTAGRLAYARDAEEHESDGSDSRW